MSYVAERNIDFSKLIESNKIYLNSKTFFSLAEDYSKFDDNIASVLSRSEAILFREIIQGDQDGIYISALFAFKFDTFLVDKQVYIKVGPFIHTLSLFDFKETLYALLVAWERKTFLVDEVCNEYDFSSIDQTFFFDTTSDRAAKDSGQAKIAFAALTPFVAFKPEDKKDYEIPNQETTTYEHLQILVVGSSSISSYAGATYLMLADILTERGHRGRIDLYDPYENRGQLKRGAFIMNFYASKYTYTTDLIYDVILDDAYQEEASFDLPPLGLSFYYDTGEKHIYSTRYKFGDKISIVYSYGELIYVHKLFNNHALDFPEKNFFIGIDINLNIMKHGKFFSTKYFCGDYPPSASVLGQPFYYKSEKRLVNNKVGRIMSTFDRVSFTTHGCNDCCQLANVVSKLGLGYAEYLRFRALAHSCLPSKGIKTLMAQNYIIAAARRKADVRIVAAEVALKCKTTTKKIERIITQMDGRGVSVQGTTVQYLTLNNTGDTSPASFIYRNKISLVGHKKFFSFVGSYADTLPFIPKTKGSLSCCVYYDKKVDLEGYDLYMSYSDYYKPPVGWVLSHQIDMFCFYHRYDDRYRIKLY